MLVELTAVVVVVPRRVIQPASLRETRRAKREVRAYLHLA